VLLRFCMLHDAAAVPASSVTCTLILRVRPVLAATPAAAVVGSWTPITRPHGTAQAAATCTSGTTTATRQLPTKEMHPAVRRQHRAAAIQMHMLLGLLSSCPHTPLLLLQTAARNRSDLLHHSLQRCLSKLASKRRAALGDMTTYTLPQLLRSLLPHCCCCCCCRHVAPNARW
jgi:hypothetical protein